MVREAQHEAVASTLKKLITDRKELADATLDCISNLVIGSNLVARVRQTVIDNFRFDAGNRRIIDCAPVPAMSR